MTRVALVTGAGAGIGAALCRALAADGCHVAVTDLDGDRACAVVDELTAQHGTGAARAWTLDVADVAAVRRVVAEAADHLDGLDVVVANAGITAFGAFLDDEPAGFDRLLAVNLRGSWFTAQAAARHMVAAGRGGAIVLMSSVTGLRAIPGLAAYGTTKAALRMMATGLAHELGRYGITVNAVAPGATLTERTAREQPRYAADWGAVAPIGRVGEVDDVAAAVVFLASPGGAHVTGQTLVVDGGWTGSSPLPPGY